MSEITEGEKAASVEQGDASAGKTPSPKRDSWDITVPELTCQEGSLDDEDERALEPSLSQDLDIKGILSRKAKSTSKGRQRSSTMKSGKGKGDDAAKKEQVKKEEKGGDLLTIQEDKEKERDETGSTKAQEAAESTIQQKAEGEGDGSEDVATGNNA